MSEKNKNVAIEILEKFNLKGKVVSCELYGNGHINYTFKVDCEDNGNAYRYILQAISTAAFKHPDEVMENIVEVTEFLKRKESDPRKVLGLIYTKDGKSYYKDKEENYWRVYVFVEDSVCLEHPDTKEEFYQCAVAFGQFQKNLSDFPAEKLHETIPDFHNTPKRFENFLKAVEEDVCKRADSVREEIEFVKKRKDFYSVLFDANEKGILPLRVTHNDTKSNNVMLDKTTEKPLCVIDLDTIMPGFSVTDFGDSIRFGASTAAEDETDLSKVWLDLEMFDIYAKGFIEGCGGKLTKDEIMLMPEGAMMMTVECGMRFLTDYLSGDTYFRIAYPEHNLVRCRTQFKLMKDMEDKLPEMKKIVSEYAEANK